MKQQLWENLRIFTQQQHVRFSENHRYESTEQPLTQLLHSMYITVLVQNTASITVLAIHQMIMHMFSIRRSHLEPVNLFSKCFTGNSSSISWKAVQPRQKPVNVLNHKI